MTYHYEDDIDRDARGMWIIKKILEQKNDKVNNNKRDQTKF